MRPGGWSDLADPDLVTRSRIRPNGLEQIFSLYFFFRRRERAAKPNLTKQADVLARRRDGGGEGEGVW